jgi:hypothetical protein
MLVFAVLLLVVISIAATLWIEMRRDERRRRLVKNVQAVLSDDGFQPSGETRLKRVA